MKKIKNKYAKKYTFTHNQLQKFVQKEVNKMQDVTLAVLAMQLRDKFGFGSKRVKRVFDGINTTIEDINNGIITPEDVFSVIEGELKLTTRREDVDYNKKKRWFLSFDLFFYI